MFDHEDEEESHAAEEVLERVAASPTNELNIRHQTTDKRQQTAEIIKAMYLSNARKKNVIPANERATAPHSATKHLRAKLLRRRCDHSRHQGFLALRSRIRR
jgi:hypothetical protein